MHGAHVGAECNIGDHAFVETGAWIGDRVTVKNGVLIWNGVRIEDDAFIGPGAVFTNDIPAYTTYVPGSLRLNSAALSDATDADAGDFSAAPVARVSVQLGTLTQASGSQTVQFAVTIN